MFSGAVTAQRHQLIMVPFVTWTNSPSGTRPIWRQCSPDGSAPRPYTAGSSALPGCGGEGDARAAGQF